MDDILEPEEEKMKKTSRPANYGKYHRYDINKEVFPGTKIKWNDNIFPEFKKIGIPHPQAEIISIKGFKSGSRMIEIKETTGEKRIVSVYGYLFADGPMKNKNIFSKIICSKLQSTETTDMD